MRIWPVGDWPALPSQLATGLLSSPEQSHFYIFVSNMKTETLTRQDVNQWQGDKDLEQEPDADITPDSVIMQCVARHIMYEDKRQGRQWHSDTQDPRAGAERLEAQDTATQTAGGGLHRHHHTWHLYCNMQTPDITTLYSHNTVFRFSINLVTRKSVTCSLVWSWRCSLLSGVLKLR